MSRHDSNKHHEDRRARMQAEAVENSKAAAEEATRVSENKEIASFHGLPKGGESRDELLARIRKMREAPPEPPPVETYRSEGLQKEFEAEQEAGRAAVAKAEAEREKYREIWAKEEAEGEKNQG